LADLYSATLPLEKMIELSKLKFMLSYVFDRLPLSFAETWVTKPPQRHPQNNLRNADLYYLPQTKQWNAADDNKYNPNRFTFIRSLKDSMFENL
jgi:hypothetical protein